MFATDCWSLFYEICSLSAGSALVYNYHGHLVFRLVKLNENSIAWQTLGGPETELKDWHCVHKIIRQTDANYLVSLL